MQLPSLGKSKFVKGSIKRFGQLPLYVRLAVAVVLMALVVFGLFILIYGAPKISFRREKEEAMAPSLSPTPTPRPLAHGKQTYSISGGLKGAPSMTEAIIDPLDPTLEQTQTLTIKAKDSKTIIQVTATLITDKGEKTHTLELVEGTQLEGTWRGSWKIEDSYEQKYRVRLKAKNADNKVSTVTLTFR